MEFHSATPTEDMPRYRWVSENNVWEIGFRPMFYGVRVSVGKTELSLDCEDGYELDYCAGSDPDFLVDLFVTVVLLLKPLPESIAPAELRRLFPSYERKPINKDPHCWKELQRLATLDNPFPPYKSVD